MSSNATGISNSVAHRSGMLKVRFATHISSSHKPQSNSKPSQGICRNCVQNTPSQDNMPPETTICCRKNNDEFRKRFAS